MSSLKEVPTDKLQAQYDAGIESIREIQERLAPLHQELSDRSNTRTFVFNQVIAGQAEALRALGVAPELIAEAQTHFEAEKTRKAQLRASSTVEVGAQ